MYTGLGSIFSDTGSSGDWCSPTDPVWCVLCGNCLNAEPAGTPVGPNPLPAPNTVPPPQIDTTPGSPTFGQAMIGGQVVTTPEQAQALINAGIDAKTAAQLKSWMASQNPPIPTPTDYTPLVLAGIGAVLLIGLARN